MRYSEARELIVEAIKQLGEITESSAWVGQGKVLITKQTAQRFTVQVMDEQFKVVAKQVFRSYQKARLWAAEQARQIHGHIEDDTVGTLHHTSMTNRKLHKGST